MQVEVEEVQVGGRSKTSKPKAAVCPEMVE